MTLFIASDHAGFVLKEQLKPLLESYGAVQDLGPFTQESVDYPDYAALVCQALSKDPSAKGVLICGTGIGMSIAANRHQGIRAALCHDGGFTARLAREHNDANILCLGSRLSTFEIASASVEIFFTTDFAHGRHEARVRKLDSL